MSSWPVMPAKAEASTAPMASCSGWPLPGSKYSWTKPCPTGSPLRLKMVWAARSRREKSCGRDAARFAAAAGVEGLLEVAPGPGRQHGPASAVLHAFQPQPASDFSCVDSHDIPFGKMVSCLFGLWATVGTLAERQRSLAVSRHSGRLTSAPLNRKRRGPRGSGPTRTHRPKSRTRLV